MQPPQRPAVSSTRRTVFITLGMLGAAFLGLIGLWCTIALRTPKVDIPTPVLPNPNAFDFYVQASNAVVGDKQIGDAAGSKPTGTYTPAQLAALVQPNLNAIATLHQGFGYPYVNPPVRSFLTLFPYYAKFRGMARLLSVQGKVRAHQGDWAGAVQSDLDAMQMGEEIPHGSVLIGYLVGVACQAIGRRPMWEALNHLDALQARAAAQRLESIMALHFPYADTIQEEKRCGQAALLELFSDAKARRAFLAPAPGEPDAGGNVQSLSTLFFLMYSKSRIMHDYTAYMDAISEQARQPYALHPALPPLPTDPFNNSVLPSFAQARIKGVDAETKNGLLLLALALHAFQSEHGRYPAALSELTPAYLKKLPDDPFAVQGTFQYRRKGNTYLLYSVGPDGKDDGGQPIDDPKQATNSNPNARYFVNERSVGDVVAGKNIY